MIKSFIICIQKLLILIKNEIDENIDKQKEINCWLDEEIDKLKKEEEKLIQKIRIEKNNFLNEIIIFGFEG